jgi:hypothetical protein
MYGLKNAITMFRGFEIIDPYRPSDNTKNLERDLFMVRDDNKNLEDHVKDLDSEIEDLKKHLVIKAKETADLKLRVAGITSTNESRYKKANEDLKKRLSAQSDKVYELERENDKAARLLERDLAQDEEKEQALATLEAERDRLQLSLQDLNVQLAALNQKVADKIEVVRQLKEDLVQMTAERDEAINEFNNFRKKVASRSATLKKPNDGASTSAAAAGSAGTLNSNSVRSIVIPASQVIASTVDSSSSSDSDSDSSSDSDSGTLGLSVDVKSLVRKTRSKLQIRHKSGNISNGWLTEFGLHAISLMRSKIEGESFRCQNLNVSKKRTKSGKFRYTRCDELRTTALQMTKHFEQCSRNCKKGFTIRHYCGCGCPAAPQSRKTLVRCIKKKKNTAGLTVHMDTSDESAADIVTHE